MAELLAHPYTALLARLIVGLVFLVSGLGKILAKQDTVRQVRAYKILPEPLARVYGRLLPWGEMGLASLLLVGLGTRLAALALGLLLMSFGIAVSVNLARGVQMDCGCSARPERLGWRTLVRIFVLLALATEIAVYEAGYLSLDLLLKEGRLIAQEQPPILGILPVLVVATVCYVGYQLAAETVQLVQSHRELRKALAVVSSAEGTASGASSGPVLSQV